MARFGKTFGVTLLVVFVAAVSCSFGTYLGSASSGGTLPGLGGDAIAVIYVEGAIQGGEGGGLFSSDGAYSDKIIRWIGRAQQDPSVRAVVLRVDSPGGGVTASDEVYNALVKLQAVKPIVASFGSLAASGGYYISAPVNTIFANETSLTGSIGVITVVPNAQGLMEKLGVEVYTITSGDHKDDTSGLKPLSDSARGILQSIVDESYQRFVTIVSEGRGISEAAVRELGDGRIYTGRQALEAGLVDELGDLPEAIDAAAALGNVQGEPRVIRYRSGGLFSGASASLKAWLGLPELPLPSLGQAPFSLQYLYLAP